VLTIGLGFRRGVTAAQIEAAIRAALETLSFNAGSGALSAPMLALQAIPIDAVRLGGAASSAPLRRCIGHVATLDVKSEEPGIVAFCTAQQIDLKGFSREVLAGLPGPSPASAIVQKRFGLSGVCESAALAGMPQGTLLLGKTSLQGVSVAIAGTLA